MNKQTTINYYTDNRSLYKVGTPLAIDYLKTIGPNNHTRHTTENATGMIAAQRRVYEILNTEPHTIVTVRVRNTNDWMHKGEGHHTNVILIADRD